MGVLVHIKSQGVKVVIELNWLKSVLHHLKHKLESRNNGNFRNRELQIYTRNKFSSKMETRVVYLGEEMRLIQQKRGTVMSVVRSKDFGFGDCSSCSDGTSKLLLHSLLSSVSYASERRVFYKPSSHKQAYFILHPVTIWFLRSIPVLIKHYLLLFFLLQIIKRSK